MRCFPPLPQEKQGCSNIIHLTASNLGRHNSLDQTTGIFSVTLYLVIWGGSVRLGCDALQNMILPIITSVVCQRDTLRSAGIYRIKVWHESLHQGKTFFFFLNAGKTNIYGKTHPLLSMTQLKTN